MRRPHLLAWSLASVCVIACAFSIANSQSPSQDKVISQCWQDLADADAALAYRAMWTLVQNPEAAVAGLNQRLQAAPAPDLDKIRKWIDELSSEKFAIRDAATKALELQGELAAAELSKALAKATDLEQRQRMQRLLGRLEGTIVSADKLRAVRAIETLELIGSAEAVELLQKLAKGYEGDRQTTEAVETLERLKQSKVGGRALAVAKADPALPKGATMRLGTTLFRQQESISGYYALSFSGDSQRIASAAESVVHVREVKTGKILRQQNYSALSVAFAPQGDTLAILLSDRALALWDAGTGKELARVALETSIAPAQVLFTSDGKQIVVKSEPRIRPDGFCVFDAQTMKKIKDWQPENPGSFFGCADDGQLVVVQPPKENAIIWNLQTAAKTPLHRFKFAPWDVAFSSDNKMMAAANGDANVQIWDVATSKSTELQTGRTKTCGQRLLFAPNGKYLAATTANEVGINVWDPQSGKLLYDLPESAGYSACAISPDSRWLAGAYGRFGPRSPNFVFLDGKSIRIWDLQTGKVHPDGAGHGSLIDRITFLPALNAVATGCDDGVFRLWDMATGKQKHVVDASAGWHVPGSAFSLDGKLLATSHMEDGVEVWDAVTGRKVYKLPGHGKLGAIKRIVHITPDGRYLTSWSPNDFNLRKWDLHDGKTVADHRIRPTGIKVPDLDGKPRDPRNLDWARLAGTDCTFTPKGDQLVLMSREMQIYFFDVATGKELRSFQADVGAREVNGGTLVLSPTGKHVAVITPGLRLTVCDAASGKVAFRHSLPGLFGKAQISSDGRTLAFVTGNTLNVIEMATGAKRVNFELPGKAKMVGISPDGRYLVVSMEDTTALVWELAVLAKR